MLERQTKNVIYNYICINRHFHNYRLPSKNKPLVLECEHWLFAKDRQLIAERFLWLIEKKEKNAIHSPKISASDFDYELFILLLTKYKKKNPVTIPATQCGQTVTTCHIMRHISFVQEKQTKITNANNITRDSSSSL